MTSTQAKPQTLSDAEKHRRSQLYARITYVAIIVIFLTVCTVAVTTTMNIERNRQGFRPIEVSKPISFFDYTYVKDGKPEPTAQPQR